MAWSREHAPRAPLAMHRALTACGVALRRSTTGTICRIKILCVPQPRRRAPGRGALHRRAPSEGLVS